MNTPLGVLYERRIHFSILSSSLLLTGLFLAGIYYSSFLIPYSYAHLEHLPHYNGGGIGLGKYYINQAIEPEYTSPGQPARIIFSIQDNRNSNDVYDIMTMVEIYSEKTGDRIKAYPWAKQSKGDFAVSYTFADVGNYQIVVSIANDYNNNNNDLTKLNGVDPPRSALSNNIGCNCDRGVFNISVSNNFGNIYNTAILAGILGIISVLGIVLGWSYRSRMKDHLYMNLRNNKDALKYFVLFFAVAAGSVHLAVYSEHSSLRIEYSIFLLAAAASQVTYGILYVLLSLTNDLETGQSSVYVKTYYRKTVILNLLGLIGSSVLVMLYIYSVVLPPPLSPNNQPDKIDFGGILDKSLEFFLLLGVIYLIRWEKRSMQNIVTHVKKSEY